MRLIVRSVAAGIAIILGLACVSVAAFGTDTPTIGLPPVPEDTPAVGTLPPLDPRTGNLERKSSAPSPSVFDSEFGQRGEHEVSVSIRGDALYRIVWRDDEVDEGSGSFQRTRTITGGFPLVQMVLLDGTTASTSTCTITVDGVEKDTQITDPESGPVICEA